MARRLNADSVVFLTGGVILLILGALNDGDLATRAFILAAIWITTGVAAAIWVATEDARAARRD